MVQSNAFTSLAVLQLPSACRLLTSACCPDKDLVVLISRLGGRDRLSLWKIQGTKMWEVDMGSDESSGEEIAALAWSPDGQSIAVAYNPPRITLHSLQDGHEERLLPIMPRIQKQSARITGIWWFREEKVVVHSSIPDIFRRDNVITGTAHSILKTLPLLDNIQEDGQKSTATDLFAFQGSQTRATPKDSVPEMIKIWPTLPSDPLAASISSSMSKQTSGTEKWNEADESNINSILIAIDDHGQIYCFLDGCYPLGVIQIPGDLSTPSIFKDPKLPVFFAHPQISAGDTSLTDLQPTIIEIPLLRVRKVRDLAKMSSTARELLWYTIRVVKEMRSAWFGFNDLGGARDLGLKWIQAIETKQKYQFGLENPDAILDLTSLLVTGRASESLSDFLGSGDQMSDRGIQKWESTVTEALVMLRDFSEKRVAPACQRLHLILEEVEGWSQLSQYSSFELSPKDVRDCLEHTSRAIIIASWLAAVARRELSRFKEFISWLRYETVVTNLTNENPPTPRHDVLEVNNYFTSGLVYSSIDKWFIGPAPHFSPLGLGAPAYEPNISAALRQARDVLNDPMQMAWQANIKRKDFDHIDRNLDGLIQELSIQCQQIFTRAAGAASRSANIRFSRSSIISQEASARLAPESNIGNLTCERIIKNEGDEFSQHFASQILWADRGFLFLAQMKYGFQASELPFHVSVALLECCLEEEQDVIDIDLLQVEFFDDECLVIVYRLRNQKGPAFIATVNYIDLGYQEMQRGGYVKVPAREELMVSAIDQWKEGHLASVRIGMKRRRALAGSDSGGIFLAVNGRAGRRVGIVLDNKGSTFESFDLEGEEEGVEE